MHPNIVRIRIVQDQLIIDVLIIKKLRNNSLLTNCLSVDENKKNKKLFKCAN